MSNRIRSYKAEFWTSEDVVSLSISARLTFLGLLTYVDDYGVGNAKTSYIKAGVYPDDDEITRGDIEGWLLEMSEREMVEFFSVDGRDYISIVNWRKHQWVSRPSKRLLPMSPREARERNSGDTPEGALREGREGESEAERERESEGDAGPRLSEVGGEPSGATQEMPPSPFCKNHQPDGVEARCRLCGNARMRHESWLARQLIAQQTKGE